MDWLFSGLLAVGTLLALPPTLLLAFFALPAATSRTIFDSAGALGAAYLIAFLPFIGLVAVGWLLRRRIPRQLRPARRLRGSEVGACPLTGCRSPRTPATGRSPSRPSRRRRRPGPTTSSSISAAPPTASWWRSTIGAPRRASRCRRSGTRGCATSRDTRCPRRRTSWPTIAGHAKGHLDVKDAGGEDDLVRLALDVLGPGQFVITTLEDSSAAAIKARFPRADDVPVALTLGRDLAGASPARRLRTRLSELRPLPRVRACGADWVAAERRLARAGVQRQCRREHVTIMVWTVNTEPELRHWLSDHRADVVITDRPTMAMELRDQGPA